MTDTAPAPAPALLTPAEVATLLRVDRPDNRYAGARYIVSLIRAGRLDGFRLSERVWRIPREAVDRFLAQHRVSSLAGRAPNTTRARRRRKAG